MLQARPRIHQAHVGESHVGEYVKDGTELVHLKDTSRLAVDFRLSQRWQPQVRVGQTLRLRVDARPQQDAQQDVLARVKAIDPALDADGRALIVRAQREQGQQGLQPGDTIVVAVQQPLQRDGTPVRVIDPNQPPRAPQAAS